MNRTEADELLNSLFAGWYGPLVRYAMRASGSLAVAEDVVQESFLALYGELLQGQEILNPKGWTLCVVRREVIKRYREQARYGGAFEPLSEAQDIADCDSDGRLSAWRDVSRLFSVLTRREEEVLMLRLKTLTYREIARQLRISTNSVKTLLSRALRKMQQASSTEFSTLQKQGDDDEARIAKTLR